MNFAGIEHHSCGNFAYPINKDELVINLKTGYDISRVFIIYEDPFLGGILGGKEQFVGQREEIYFKKNLKYQRWWTTTIKPPYKRVKYYFELYRADECFFLFEDGILNDEQFKMQERSKQCFVYPWMNEADINQTPTWVNDTIWYQIFPDRFCNGDISNDIEGVSAWNNGEEIHDHYAQYGGDLQGIINKLDYLEDLGISGLYLTPIFEAMSNHKYDTTDYFKIDPHFGDEALFKSLVEKAHSKNIKIMIDGVFNHVGTNFPIWQDVLINGRDSRYFDWFMINTWPLDATARDTKDGAFYSFAFSNKMPKLNTNNDEVIDYLISICAYWVKQCDIDGIRLDVANEISHKFNKRLREAMVKIKPDIYILGEIWHEASDWLRGDEFHSVMNYPLTASINDFFVDNNLSKQDFEAVINQCYTIYMQQINDVLFNLLDSHDTMRLINKVHHNKDKFRQMLALLFVMPGSPCIYYGSEIVLEGSYDPDCRRCMPWINIDEQIYDEDIAFLKQLIALRKSCKALRSRNFHFTNLIENPRLIEFLKIDGDNYLEVFVNLSDIDEPLDNYGEVLLCAKFENNVLQSGGFVIRKQRSKE